MPSSSRKGGRGVARPDARVGISAERKTLLALARQCLAIRPFREKPPEIDLRNTNAKLTAPGRASYAHEQGLLRGCIGPRFPREPLVQAVVDKAGRRCPRRTAYYRRSALGTGSVRHRVLHPHVARAARDEVAGCLLGQTASETDGVVLRVGRRQSS
jgi:hypothetical protein